MHSNIFFRASHDEAAVDTSKIAMPCGFVKAMG
jgi:hypothetical protein